MSGEDPRGSIMAGNGPVGIDRARVTEWFERHIDAVRPPLHFERIARGSSNLTFRVEDGSGRRVVLRRPPTGHVLASAHDMTREHRVITAMGPTPVPVPQTLGLCTDETVNEAPFYVMSFVEGTIVFDRDDALRVDPEIRPRMTESLVDTVAALHALDPDTIGLGDLGRKEDYCARQLRRWKRQIDAGTDREIPLLHELHARMVDSIPLQQGAGVVHGDFRLDNCMMSPTGTVVAVLDWELCTLGDVLADLAGMVAYWGDDPLAMGRLAEMPTGVEGFGSADEMVAGYAARSDRDLSELPWYVAFQHWRLACIIEGVRVRFELGAMGDDHGHDEPDAIEGIDYMLEKAKTILDG
jgi:aminoglycoside phosphotransferase (APT) family kinase protein